MGVAAIIVSDATDIVMVQRALDSVMYQTHPVDEIVIVEAKRRIMDDLEQLVEFYDRDIVINHCFSYNASLARNRGAYLVSSEFICFLDADDEWSPTAIEDRLARVRDDVCMVTSPYAVENKHKELIRFRPTKPTEDSIMAENTIGSTSYVMLRRSTFMKVGGFDHKLIYKQEWDLWIRMLKEGRVTSTGKVGGIKFYNPTSASRHPDVVSKGWDLFLRKHEVYYRNHPDEADHVLIQYQVEMSRFGDYPKPFFGPLGWLQVHFFRKLPSWINLDFYWNRENRNLLMSKEEVASMKAKKEAEERGEVPEQSKVVYFIPPLFKRWQPQ